MELRPHKGVVFVQSLILFNFPNQVCYSQR